MNREEIIEALELLGYRGNKLNAVYDCVMEFSRRKSVFLSEPITSSDIATVTLIFDSFNKAMSGNSPRK